MSLLGVALDHGGKRPIANVCQDVLFVMIDTAGLQTLL